MEGNFGMLASHIVNITMGYISPLVTYELQFAVLTYWYSIDF